MKRTILLLATQNAKKAKELQTLLPEYSVQTLADAGIDLEVVEDGKTFAENAQKKVDGIYAHVQGTPIVEQLFAILADDSGICVDALQGGPGIRSARFAKDHDAGAGDAANNALLLEKLKNTPDGERGAHFYCAIAMKRLDTDKDYCAVGKVFGSIAHDEIGEGGFGYDPLFIPDAYPDRRTAELTAEEKHAISHRGEAMRKIAHYL